MDYQKFASITVDYCYHMFCDNHQDPSVEFIEAITRIAEVPLEDIKRLLVNFYNHDKDKVNEFVTAIEQVNAVK